MLDSLLNFIFYPVCSGCDVPGESVCRQCVDDFKPARLKCHKCDRKNPYGIYCVKCTDKYTPERVLALYHFDKTLKELIHSFKYEDEKELADIFSEKMADYIQSVKFTGFTPLEKTAKRPLSLTGFTLAPIPISKKRQRFRGYNQSELLAREIAKKTGLEYADILQRNPRQNSQVQAGSRKKRKANVKGAFILKKNLEIPSKILLVDDVITTGATIEEATKILKKAGVKEVIALALAMG